jgi:hypothetical protein
MRRTRVVVACLAASLTSLGLLLPASGQDPATPAPATPPPAGQDPVGQDPGTPGTPATPPPGHEPAGHEPAGHEPAGHEPAGGGNQDPLAPRRGRHLDPDAPVARALRQRLAVDPRYASDGTVELIYDFTREADVADWTMEGFDRAEEGGPRGGRGARVRRTGKTVALSLGCGSSGQGLLLHCLDMKGDYEVTIRAHVERTSTRSELVFLLGKGGASWGTQLVQRTGGGFAPIGEHAVDKDAWVRGRVVTITVAARDGELTTSVNNVRVDGSTRLRGKLDGKVGVYLTDMLLVVQRITIRGTVDAAKL